MPKRERPQHRGQKAGRRPPRDYWFPGFWPSAPHPELGGNPREVDMLHAELGGLTYRWSASARTTGDSRLIFFADFLWLVLVAWSELPFGDADRSLRGLRDKARTYLGVHTPEGWRTDHAATGIVFDWDRILAARKTLGARPALGPPPLPAWFPVYDPTSLANGSIAIAEAVLSEGVVLA